MISVFVYGTLLAGESNHHVAAPFLISVQPGTIFGRLYDVGPYPTLALTEGSHKVIGEWFEVTEEGLQAMDILEGYNGPGASNEYERVWVSDVNGLREGWVYIWENISELVEINSSSWRAYSAQKNK
ncbi:gamma-glutamylcyclotransferase [Paenibacillus frigoriresistens]|uniref:gamma-glutamylcyclotransferase family protein n=1 Tax=Paenibacillus alginolyticus TaxID=59839 RepID=UPI0015631BE5|nr:gamma-glutamylcyclotransferase family protein [Paenibacillus frigoriresistens]NRF90305.1 gamma-glutamylcyclotransferase [Paenibacillus frigoriresistens]